MNVHGPSGAHPDLKAMLVHLEFLAAPAHEGFSDALIEIAWDGGAYGEHNSPTRAKLFGLNELDAAAEQAAAMNKLGCNIYVGATLKKPGAMRDRRTKTDDFYVATAVPIDIDSDTVEVKARLARLGVRAGAIVTTGSIPSLRQQRWYRLTEPCDGASKFGRAFVNVVGVVRADKSATGVGRLMRLAGSVSYPPGKKRKKGYVVELTSIKIDSRAEAVPTKTFLGLAADAENDSCGVKQGNHRPDEEITVFTPTGKFLTDINTLALWNLDAWVPALFGRDAIKRSRDEDGYRVTSEALWRDLEEDLSLSPQGIKDFGVHDMDDPREGKRSPIDIVIEWHDDYYGVTLDDGTPPTTPMLAAEWLCEKLGFDVDVFKKALEPWRKQRLAAQFFETPEREVIEKDGELLDAATGEVVMKGQVEAPKANKPGNTGDYIAAILARRGLVRDIALWILSVSRRPQPAFAVAAALTIVATAAGRQLRTPTDAIMNVYVLLVGRTGVGKDTPLKAVDNILDAAGLDRQMLHRGAFKSEIAVYSHAYRHPVSVVVINEFGDVVKATNSRNASAHSLLIMSTLREFWDGGTLNAPLAMSRPPMTVRDPCMSLLCASTPEQFYGSVGNAEVLNGFLNRFLTFQEAKGVTRGNPSGRIQEVPEHIAKRVREIADLPGGEKPARFRAPLTEENPHLDVRLAKWADASVEAAWMAYEDECLELSEVDKRREQLGPRCAHNAIKIATILAISENPCDPVVTREHFEIGKALVETSLREMTRGYEEHEDDSPTARLQEKVLYHIRKAGGVIEKRALFRSVQRGFKDMNAFRGIIETLEAAGRIEILAEKRDGGGHNTIRYHLLD